MPIDYDIDDGVIVLRLHGQVTSQECTDHIARIDADPRYHPNLPRLGILASDAKFPSSAEIIKFAVKVTRRNIGSSVRIACVATTPLAVGIVSMFMGNAGLTNNFHLFDSEPAAREWLKAGGA